MLGVVLEGFGKQVMFAYEDEYVHREKNILKTEETSSMKLEGVCVCLYVCVLGFEPRSLCMLGKHSTRVITLTPDLF